MKWDNNYGKKMTPMVRTKMSLLVTKAKILLFVFGDRSAYGKIQRRMLIGSK